MVSEQNVPNEPKDYTRFIWVGIGFLVVLMLVAVWWAGRLDTTASTVRARHILISYDPRDPADKRRARQQAEELRERIMEGESFARIARTYSADGTSAARGGLLQTFTKRDELEPAFEAYVWEAPVGAVSEVISTSQGYHIVRVEERQLSEADRYSRKLEDRATGSAQSRGGAMTSTPESNTGALPTAPMQ
ncbi:MAG: peptidylprolyl isomerase [Candidatus Hydrogenedentota bacterium]